VTRGQLPQRAGSLSLNGGGTAAAVPPNDGVTRSGTGCFIAVLIMATVGIKGLIQTKPSSCGRVAGHESRLSHGSNHVISRETDNSARDLGVELDSYLV